MEIKSQHLTLQMRSERHSAQETTRKHARKVFVTASALCRTQCSYIAGALQFILGTQTCSHVFGLVGRNRRSTFVFAVQICRSTRFIFRCHFGESSLPGKNIRSILFRAWEQWLIQRARQRLRSRPCQLLFADRCTMHLVVSTTPARSAHGRQWMLSQP